MSTDPELQCLVCQDVVPQDGKYLTCTKCDYAYHLGKCSGVSAPSFRNRSESFKATWICATCETAERKSGVVATQSESSSFAAQLKTLNDNVASLLPIIGKVNALSELLVTVGNIETSMKFLSEKYDSVLTKVEKQDSDIAALKKRVDRIESGTSPAIRQIRLDLNEMEQYSRRQNLEILGLAKEEHEDLFEKVNTVARKLELPELTRSDIDGMHRLPQRPGKEPAVIVRFTSVSLKQKWMEARSRLRAKEPDMRFFDNLTPWNKRLLWLARARAEEVGYRFAWQNNGHVLVRKDEGDKVIRIQDECDLEKMV